MPAADQEYRPPPGSPEEARAVLIAIVAELRGLRADLQANTLALENLRDAGIHVQQGGGGVAGTAKTIAGAVRDALLEAGVLEEDDEDEAPAPRRQRARRR